MPRFPQTIPQAGSCHRESCPLKPRRRAPDLGQSINNATRRPDVADVSHNQRPPRRQDYQQPAVSSRINRLQPSPLNPANPKPDDLSYTNTIETGEDHEVFPAS